MPDYSALVAEATALARDADRPDLLRRLEGSSRRLRQREIRVLVVGDIKQGKSALINALVSAPVCCVDDAVATVAPTVIAWGAEPAAHVVIEPPGGGRERQAISMEAVGDHVSERGNPGNSRHVVAVEVTLPRGILDGGLTLIDSPGVGGNEPGLTLATITALPSADAVLFVSDASQEYTEPELQLLQQALRLCPNVACVLTKTDLYPEWRRVLELDRAHLERAGMELPIHPVSAELRMAAIRTSDLSLNAESGFPELVTYLRGGILADAHGVLGRSITHDVLAVTDNLSLTLGAELHALVEPEATPRVLAELEAAKQRADELRRRSARWQTALGDGVADLMSDLEYDLRDRMRVLQREAEQAIDSGDPGPVWMRFVEWFEQRTIAAVSDTYVWTDERVAWLAAQVAGHFADGSLPLPELRSAPADDVLKQAAVMPELEDDSVGIAQKVLVGLRGSYGGVLMTGLMTGLLGMALINPLSIAAGVLIGRKVYRDDQDNRLRRRRGEAKVLVRRQSDEVVFQVAKQLKDRVKLVQRALRDHFTAIAEEHSRTLAESLLAAQTAASRYANDRDRRVIVLRASLKRVEALRSNAPVLAAAAPKQELSAA